MKCRPRTNTRLCFCVRVHRTHNKKTEFLRSMRLAPMLLAIAHTFIRHQLRASSALPLTSPAALAALASGSSSSSSSAASASPLPPYLSFHVRRGDFLHVHKSVVPDLRYLAQQISQRFRHVWTNKSSEAPPLSTRVFLSSDMTAEEFAELQQHLEEAHAEIAMPLSELSTALPVPQLVRFDLEQVRQQLRSHFSEPVNAYLDASTAFHASSTVETPLTPFHVLLLDQYLCEQSLPFLGFVGTRHSYVSEMVWQQRRALGLENNNKEEKDVLEGGSGEETKTSRKDEL